MPSPPLLTRLVGLVRRQPPPPDDVLHPYAAVVLPAADRTEVLYHDWFEHTALVADSEKLANAAAIHRWEAATIARRLEGVTPPTELTRDHARLVEAIRMASRASQLLSSGSRYHNANALCEGQMLLTESRTRRLKALALLRRFLVERPYLPDPPAPPEPAHPEMAGPAPAGAPTLGSAATAAGYLPADPALSPPVDGTPTEPAATPVPRDP